MYIKIEITEYSIKNATRQGDKIKPLKYAIVEELDNFGGSEVALGPPEGKR